MAKVLLVLVLCVLFCEAYQICSSTGSRCRQDNECCSELCLRGECVWEKSNIFPTGVTRIKKLFTGMKGLKGFHNQVQAVPTPQKAVQETTEFGQSDQVISAKGMDESLSEPYCSEEDLSTNEYSEGSVNEYYDESYINKNSPEISVQSFAECPDRGKPCRQNNDCCSEYCRSSKCVPGRRRMIRQETEKYAPTSPETACIGDWLFCRVDQDCCSGVCHDGHCDSESFSSLKHLSVENVKTRGPVGCKIEWNFCNKDADCCSGRCSTVSSQPMVYEMKCVQKNYYHHPSSGVQILPSADKDFSSETTEMLKDPTYGIKRMPIGHRIHSTETFDVDSVKSASRNQQYSSSETTEMIEGIPTEIKGIPKISVLSYKNPQEIKQTSLKQDKDQSYQRVLSSETTEESYENVPAKKYKHAVLSHEELDESDPKIHRPRHEIILSSETTKVTKNTSPKIKGIFNNYSFLSYEMSKENKNKSPGVKGFPIEYSELSLETTKHTRKPPIIKKPPQVFSSETTEILKVPMNTIKTIPEYRPVYPQSETSSIVSSLEKIENINGNIPLYVLSDKSVSEQSSSEYHEKPLSTIEQSSNIYETPKQITESFNKSYSNITVNSFETIESMKEFPFKVNDDNQQDISFETNEVLKQMPHGIKRVNSDPEASTSATSEGPIYKIVSSTETSKTTKVLYTETKDIPIVYKVPPSEKKKSSETLEILHNPSSEIIRVLSESLSSFETMEDIAEPAFISKNKSHDFSDSMSETVEMLHGSPEIRREPDDHESIEVLKETSSSSKDIKDKDYRISSSEVVNEPENNRKSNDYVVFSSEIYDYLTTHPSEVIRVPSDNASFSETVEVIREPFSKSKDMPRDYAMYSSETTERIQGSSSEVKRLSITPSSETMDVVKESTVKTKGMPGELSVSSSETVEIVHDPSKINRVLNDYSISSFEIKEIVKGHSSKIEDVSKDYTTEEDKFIDEPLSTFSTGTTEFVSENTPGIKRAQSDYSLSSSETMEAIKEDNLKTNSGPSEMSVSSFESIGITNGHLSEVKYKPNDLVALSLLSTETNISSENIITPKIYADNSTESTNILDEYSEEIRHIHNDYSEPSSEIIEIFKESPAIIKDEPQLPFETSEILHKPSTSIIRIPSDYSIGSAEMEVVKEPAAKGKGSLTDISVPYFETVDIIHDPSSEIKPILNDYSSSPFEIIKGAASKIISSPSEYLVSKEIKDIKGPIPNRIPGNLHTFSDETTEIVKEIPPKLKRIASNQVYSSETVELMQNHVYNRKAMPTDWQIFSSETTKVMKDEFPYVKRIPKERQVFTPEITKVIKEVPLKTKNRPQNQQLFSLETIEEDIELGGHIKGKPLIKQTMPVKTTEVVKEPWLPNRDYYVHPSRLEHEPFYTSAKWPETKSINRYKIPRFPANLPNISFPKSSANRYDNFPSRAKPHDTTYNDKDSSSVQLHFSSSENPKSNDFSPELANHVTVIPQQRLNVMQNPRKRCRLHSKHKKPTGRRRRRHRMYPSKAYKTVGSSQNKIPRHGYNHKVSRPTQEDPIRVESKSTHVNSQQPVSLINKGDMSKLLLSDEKKHKPLGLSDLLRLGENNIFG